MKSTYIVFGKPVVASSIDEAFSIAKVYETVEKNMSYNKRVNSSPVKN